MGIWQKRLGRWGGWWNTQIKANPTQVHDQMDHPVLISKQSGRVRVFFMEMVPAAVVVLAASTAVDSLMYGNLEVVPWNFFRVNVLSGVAAHYGVHPFHWYLSQVYLDNP